MARARSRISSAARFVVAGSAVVGLALAGCGGSGPKEHRAGIPLTAKKGCPLRGLPGPQRAQYNATRLVGMTLAEATRTARAHGCVVRAVRVDGREQTVTRDFRTYRIDVAIDRSSRVVAFEGIY